MNVFKEKGKLNPHNIKLLLWLGTRCVCVKHIFLQSCMANKCGRQIDRHTHTHTNAADNMIISFNYPFGKEATIITLSVFEASDTVSPLITGNFSKSIDFKTFGQRQITNIYTIHIIYKIPTLL